MSTTVPTSIVGHATISPGQRLSKPGEPVWEVAWLFPAQGAWSEEEYLALDTKRLVELSNGCLEVLAMPTVFHHLIVDFLHGLLQSFVRSRALGTVLFAPLPVRLGFGRYREPDIVYLRTGRVHDVHGQPDGADLVVEVVSEGPEARERDLEIKRREYAQAGIAEYWIVDPDQRRITVLVLDGQSYRMHGEFGPGSMASAVLLGGFTASVDAVFAAGEGVQ